MCQTRTFIHIQTSYPYYYHIFLDKSYSQQVNLCQVHIPISIYLKLQLDASHSVIRGILQGSPSKSVELVWLKEGNRQIGLSVNGVFTVLSSPQCPQTHTAELLCSMRKCSPFESCPETETETGASVTTPSAGSGAVCGCGCGSGRVYKSCAGFIWLNDQTCTAP